MQGCPGSGKSRMAEVLRQYYENLEVEAQIYSADRFWYECVGDDKGRYDFVPELRYRAHQWCQQGVLGAMKIGIPVIIVDNTNTTKKEAVPYRVMANLFDYAVHVVRVDPGVEECIRRQASRPEDRRVPEDIIRTMHGRLETLIPDEPDFLLFNTPWSKLTAPFEDDTNTK